MPNLSSLNVELGVNSAKLETGLEKATYATKQFGKQLESAFKQAANSIGVVTASFGAFGPEGALVTEVLAAMGAAIGATTARFATMNKTWGVAIGSAAGLAAGSAAAAAAIVGMAAHTDEANAKLFRQSEMAGVSFQGFQRLAAGAKLAGVDTETLAMGMQRLDKAAVKAAESNNYSSTAFGRLGINVKDANGHLKDSETLMVEASAKFSTMSNETERTARAMELFGRGGAALIPFLIQGPEKMKEFADYAQKVGAVLSDDAGRGAEKFHESMEKIELISQGVQNQLATGVTPSLNKVVGAFADAVQGGNAFVEIGQAVGKVLEYLVIGLEELGYWSTLAGVGLSKVFEFFAPSAKKAGEELQHQMTLMEEGKGNVKALADAQRDYARATEDATLKEFARDQVVKDANKNRDAFFAGLHKVEPFRAPKTGGGGGNTEPGEDKLEKSLAEIIAKLHEQEGALGNGGRMLKEWQHTAEGAALSQELFRLRTEGATKAQMDHVRALAMGVDNAKMAAEGKKANAEIAFKEALDAATKAVDAQNLALRENTGDMKALPNMIADLGSKLDTVAPNIHKMSDDFKHLFETLKMPSGMAHVEFFRTLKAGMDGLNQSMAQFIVTGRGGFLGVLQQMEMGLIKLGIGFLEAKAQKALFDALGIAGDTAKATASNVARQAAIGTAGAEAASSAAIAGPLAAAAAATTTISELEGITSIGFAETGADVTAGQAIIVGEKRPEVFVPGSSGHIYPSVQNGGGGHTVNVHTHINTVDAENFGALIEKHSKVVAAHVGRQLRLSNSAL